MRAPTRQSIGLIGTPVSWLLQVILSEMLSSYACYPHEVALKAPQWDWLEAALTTISIISFIIALVSAAMARTSWQRARTSGERQRFIAMLGMMTSLLFLIAILITACALLLVAPCHS